ncbi:MAG: hypothetical protein IKB01_01800 [Lachnospiraceae bacterium]|nr:hypothetical protein [Lachnospiraceae bacterium]
MNSFQLFSVRIAGNVTQKEISTGPFVYFRAGEKVSDTKWQNYLCVAFGEMAEKVSRMKLKQGACVNIIGSISIAEEGVKVKITDISYAIPFAPQKKEEPSEPVVCSNDMSSINLDSNDIFASCDVNALDYDFDTEENPFK